MSLVNRLTTWVSPATITPQSLNTEFDNVTNTLNGLNIISSGTNITITGNLTISSTGNLILTDTTNGHTYILSVQNGVLGLVQFT